ncbi:unnamed protein product [Mytilus coruscus]|uniref:Integrase catalytic domain-containing protein n=1 Tax=Mytilus coruscus TaxID=42192 RepID=A0A6J8CVK9_MYTCO|nr:unnamed protein product [Mytilus coruscus]
MFKTLKLVYEGTRSHTGYHKLFKDVKDTFYGLCKEFIKGCVKCAYKKPQNNIAPLKPISSKHFMHRGQLDLVDKRADPEGPFCWIGHYIDHFSKFNFFWPQERKSAIEVAHNLKVHVFSVIGLPFILQHDNGREFCNDIIRETIKIWPGGNVKIITGRPRHPRTQGLVEQVHNSLHRLLAAKRSETPGSGWLEHLYEVQYSLNTQHHSSIKHVDGFGRGCGKGYNECDLGNWMAWGRCDARCGGGTQQRQKAMCCDVNKVKTLDQCLVMQDD